MATAGKQDKLNIQIKSIKTAMSTMLMKSNNFMKNQPILK